MCDGSFKLQNVGYNYYLQEENKAARSYTVIPQIVPKPAEDRTALASVALLAEAMFLPAKFAKKAVSL